MAGTWPNLDASDLETRVRTYLNEVTAKFYTQAEIWRWLSVGAKEIARKTFCVQRILNKETGSGVREVYANVLKVHYVEYIPSSGRAIMLTRIDPLKTGNKYPLRGTAPQYWFEYGANIGIEPIPDAIYQLRLYVSDVPKMMTAITSFASGWTAGTGWVVGDTAIHSSTSSDLTYDTVLTENGNYTFEFRITDVGTSSSVTPYAGELTGTTISSKGYSTQNMVALGGAPYLKFTGVGDIVLEGLTIYKENDYSAVGDQIELSTAWQHSLTLYAALNGLIKNRQYAAASLLATIHGNEISYLKQNLVDIIPDGRSNLVYE